MSGTYQHRCRERGGAREARRVGRGGGGRGAHAAPAVYEAGGRSGSWTLPPQLRPDGSSARPSSGARAAPSGVSPPGLRRLREGAESGAGGGGTPSRAPRD